MTSKAPLVAAVLTSLAVLTACTAAPGPSGPSTSSRSSTPSSAADQVTLHGVSMALPSGWSQGQPTLCGPVLEHTITVHEGRPQVAACPSTSVRQPDGETVSLIEIFGAWGSMGWTGKQITFGGQPAWVTQEDSDGKPVPPCLGQSGATTPCPPTSSAADRLLSTTLALPWLNATIVIRDATSARTDELLAQVTVHAETFLTVPASASSMSVVSAGGYDNPKTTTSPAVIDSTLAALRGSPPLAVDHACRLPATLGPVTGGKVVTFVDGSVSTSFLIANEPCGQVTAGTGAASRANAELFDAVAQVPLPAMR